MIKKPVIGSEWQRIVYYPSNHLNDFCVIKDNVGLWHCIGITGEGTWESETRFFHSFGKSLDSPFTNAEPILTQEFAPDDIPYKQKHAPFIVEKDGVFHMFYRRPMGTIMHIETTDLFKFEDLGREVFTKRDARDICVLKIGDAYVMYYCQSELVDGVPYSCVIARTSKTLTEWGEPRIVYRDEKARADHSHLESPYVIAAEGGYYLFIRHRLRDEDETTIVLFSEDPFAFNDGGLVQKLNNVHAAEIFKDKDEFYIARVSFYETPKYVTGDGWIEIAKLKFAE